MAYAHCPNCQKAFRYKLLTAGPAWLKDVARSLGRGETAVLLCQRCWLVPETGDEVTVLSRREELPAVAVGAVGRVVEIQNAGSAYPIFVVEGLAADQKEPWHGQFMRWEIQAGGVPAQGTVQLLMRSDQNGG